MTRPVAAGSAHTVVHTILAIACLSGCGAPIAREVVVDRFDVALKVLADGSVDVRETMTVRAEGPAPGRFARDVAATRVDRISEVEATGDGRPAGLSGGGVRVDRTGGVHVTWLIEPDGGAPRTLTLCYRLAGALRIQGPRGILQWSALPPDRRYRVGATRVDLAIPPGSLFAVGPALEGGRATFVQRPAGATWGLATVAPEESTAISAEIDFGTADVPEPVWQSNALRAHQLMPAFVAAGVCLMGIGAGVLVMIRLQYPPRTAPSTDRGSDRPLASPESLTPAMAAALVRARLTMDPAARVAAVLDLAKRGFVGVSAGGFVPKDPGVVVVSGGADGLRAHERAIVDALWLGRDGAGPTSLPVVEALLARIRRRLDRALAEDLTHGGLLEAERLTVARGLRATGLVALVLAAAGAVACQLALAKFGVWPQAVPLGLAVMSGLFVWAGIRMPYLSEPGARASVAWSARVTERQAAARTGEIPAAEFERGLPIAVACGFAIDWIGAWERLGQTPPPWDLVLGRQYTSRL